MAPKRKFNSGTADATTTTNNNSPAKRARTSNRPPTTTTSSHTQHNHGTLPKKTNPINPLKSRIRSLNRLLADDDDHNNATNDDKRSHNGNSRRKSHLGADIRIAKERELKSLLHDLAAAERAERRRVAIGKWHMVRFFDRKKAERRLRQVVKRAKDVPGCEVDQEGVFVVIDGVTQGGAEGMKKVEEIRREVHAARVDLKYTLFCPLESPYASLWPGKGRKSTRGEQQVDGDEADVSNKDLAQGDREMWLLVEKCMAEGRLEQLRSGEAPELKKDRQLEHGGAVKVAGNTKSHGSKGTSKANGRHDASKKSAATPVDKDKQQQEDDGDESDGGFFE